MREQVTASGAMAVVASLERAKAASLVEFSPVCMIETSLRNELW